MSTTGRNTGAGSRTRHRVVTWVTRQCTAQLAVRLSASAATAVSALIVSAHSAGPFGQMVTVAFVLLTPALAISGLLPRVNGAVVALVAGAGAVAINAGVAQTMLSVNRWSPEAAVVVVGLITSLVWLLPSALLERTVTRRGNP